ncbi:unnamed protein product [Triticum turgidum subsp. durum]|uniref:DNA polymerase n=1 Tax=Triticum turgidum subsp. durum TaxID=4567 RepID=A0A9R1NKQ0_TRITD|nr:unnamed protein product [Triticum turgidum subsp. durum]
MAPPVPGLDISYSPFHCEEVEEVPVIRIYGSTPAGQKTCLHIHQSLPYLYVPCPEELLHNIERGNSCMTGLLSDLEKTLQSYDRKFSWLEAVKSVVFTLVLALIDYNLYGMGHVHVTDFKFRPPLPGDFHPKTLHRKTHSYNAAMKNPIIWTSSTVPHALILGDSSTSHFMEGSSSNFRKRHTFMMLEADSRVEGIINEKYKMYTSLSQTTADTKMVQSLLAIWEELEHLRLLDETKPADIGRPPRDAVLKSFIHGIKYESALSALDPKEEGSHHKDSAVEASEKLERCFKSLTDVVGTITFSQNDCCENIGSDNSAQRTSQSFDEHEKHVDSEALGLLSWMASSQAGEEPTTDDELVNEVILSPLFSKKSIEFALESAHLDFDSASQQECQDILDTLEPMTGAEELNAKNSYHSSPMLDESTSVANTIPQIDGSSDEKQKGPQEYDQGKITRRKIGTASYSSSKNSSKLASKHGCTELLWGSLPLSTKKRSHGNADGPVKLSSGSAMPTEDPSSYKSKTEKNSCDTTDNNDKESSGSIGEHGSACLSVRDLMRRKRRGSFQPEKLDFGCSGTAACNKDKTSGIVISGGLEVHDVTSGLPNSETSYSGGEYVHMTFAQKPPTGSEVSSASIEHPESAKLGSVDPLPFFNQTAEENKENGSFQYMGSSEFTSDTLGVPTHFQNDGSVLYLLTHAFSPPSAAAVGQWLPQHTYSISVSGYFNCGENVTDDQEIEHHPTSTPHAEALPLMANSPVPGSASEHTTTTFIDTVMMKSDQPNKENKKLDDWHDFSQISAEDEKHKLTPLSQIGFRDPASTGGGQQLTILSIEVFAESRAELRPDPRFDAINVVSLAVEDDGDNTVEVRVLIRGNNDKSQGRRNLDGVIGCSVDVFPEERNLLYHLIDALCSIDPDILVGWEIQLGSLGFLAERAAYLGIGLLKRISRTLPHESKYPPKNLAHESSQVPEASPADDVIVDVSENDWSHTHASGVHVGGRIVLNLWRLMRGEVKLNNYSLEAVADEVLRRKVPLVPNKTLNRWFATGPGQGRHRCIEYVNSRAMLNLEIINQLDLVNRTSELARVFGIDFFSVLSRGSQFRVESMLLRLAHTQNYLAISPGNQQILSRFCLVTPVLRNKCKNGSSCSLAYLPRVFPSKSSVLGVSSYSADPHTIADLKNQLILTPNGVLYVQPEVRKGVVPRLLEEILSTRIMVKQALKKLAPSQKVLQKILNARQLALKLIANVTYGYTAAGFSGRMPCAELADSIVQCGRRTLETAISFVNQHPLWNARVVYGDTDSMFVLLKGRSREEAFRIGKEIASLVTAINPDPVTLKFEKVYHPCFLLTKKRYVGYSYENPEQNEPIFDAKGIETVRRDTCPAVAKMLERSLRIMFEEQDLVKVKSYVERQRTRILSGKVSIQDFIFAKEVRLGTYSARASSLPPAAIVATKAMLSDPRAEPRYAERVPYVVIHGEPGARLVDMVINPYGLLEVGSPYRLNELYYITKQIIPALQRVFGLLGVNLNKWFKEMPRPTRSTLAKRQSALGHGSRDSSSIRLGWNKKPSAKVARIDTYYMSSHCTICGDTVQGSETFCSYCLKNEAVVATVVTGRTSKLEREIQHLAAVCGHCGGADWIMESGVKCVSLACPVFYERRKIQKELRVVSESAGEAGYYPFCCGELF